MGAFHKLFRKIPDHGLRHFSRRLYSPRMKRRHFISSATAALAGGGSYFASSISSLAKASDYQISLAQWSQHRALKGGTLDNLDWPSYVKKHFDINALEWVNQFFAEKQPNLGKQPNGGDYLAQMKKRCDDNGVKTLLIMCDGVGNLGDPDDKRRNFAVEGHYAWLEASKFLGGHSIRVNAASNPKLPWDEQVKLCADGLRRLSEKAATMGLNVIVENHGGFSSNGAWLSEVMKTVDLPNCGTLPDFGNFYVAKNRGNEEQFAAARALYDSDEYTVTEKGIEYDRYLGVKQLMPFAKGVSAKSHDFNEAGDEVNTDFKKMMEIVKASGYTGYVGIEYEGKELPEDEGILATKKLLERVFAEI